MLKNQLSNESDVSIVVLENGNRHEFSGKGLKPLLECVTALKEKTQDANIADKIVGKAAALIIVNAGFKSVYAKIMSCDGEKVLKTFGVRYEYESLVPHILGRNGGMCPMEEKCQAIDSPRYAFEFFSTLILGQK